MEEHTLRPQTGRGQKASVFLCSRRLAYGPSTIAGTSGLRDQASGNDCVAQYFYVSGLLGWLIIILP